ncbi:MAG: ferredoxin--NADP reductase, partial [Endozoicomonas sp.]
AIILEESFLNKHLEFLSIKVPGGPLTSRLQHLQPGDSVLVSRKPVGTLMVTDLKPARHLFLLATGTGLAPFLSIIKDPETYERFEKVILVHGVRWESELAYHDYLLNELPYHEYLGEEIRKKLQYYPTVTREPFRNTGRITELIQSNRLCDDLGLNPLNPETDKVMICGSQEMISETCSLLDGRGFIASSHTGDVADYVIERAFVEK